MKIWLPSIRARSGADVYVERLAEGLREHGAEPVVEWFPHKYQYAPWLLRARRAPPGIEIINAVSWIAFAFGRRGVPLVATTHHCVAGRGYPQWKSLPQMLFHDQLVYRFERASFAVADAVVAVSESTRHDVREDFGVVANVRVIHNWVDTQVFSPSFQETTRCAGKTRILIVGNMSRRKGGDLIAPFCDALGTAFEVTVVAGLRGERPSVSPTGAALRFVSGLTTAQLAEAYRNTDIVVSLSRHEGFGYTALEGMACSKPVVAFDVSGLRDVVTNGATGLLVPVEDVAALAASCRTLQANPTRACALGHAGLQRAVTVFAKERAIEAYVQLYSELSAK